MGTARIPMLLTRPSGSNERFVEKLPVELRTRVDITMSPLIEVMPRQQSVKIGPSDAAIFTSRNGVRYAPDGQSRDAFCVGETTTQAAAQAGWNSHCLGKTSQELVSALVATKPKSTLFHMSGSHVVGDIVGRLANEGLSAKRCIVYDQELRPLNKKARLVLMAQSGAVAPLFSPRTAAQFATECPPDAKPHVIALSGAVALSLGRLETASLDIAVAPDADSVVACLEKLLHRIGLG